jgi:DNA (cytosine-5)-methyltransferase 1
VRKRELARVPAVSLFSNCGAGDIGFAQAGFTFEVMAELDPRRLEIALLNHPRAAGVPGDLRNTLDDVIATYRQRRHDSAPALLAACPPCQGMSSAQSSRGAGDDPDIGSLDHRNLLVEVITKAVWELRPRIVVVENVREFLTRQVRHPVSGVPVSAANLLIDSIKNSYTVYPLVADLSDFGVPQSRRRSFLTFVRDDDPSAQFLQQLEIAPYPRPSRKSTSLAEALDSFHLPSLDASSRESAESQVPLHMVPVWPTRLYNMISAIPPNSGSSAWQNSRCSACGTQCPDLRRTECDCGAILPRPVVRNKDGTVRLVAGFHSSYRRMDPNIPASTVTTASGHVGSDRTVHPWETRVLSPLECSLLQTFPRSFKWGKALAEWGHTNVRAMIGEAVPPLFTRKHGKVLLALLNETCPQTALGCRDSRLSVASASLEAARRRSDAYRNSHDKS